MSDLDSLFGTAPAPVKAAAVECPAPGIYYDVPAHVYHRWGCISSTLLKGYANLPSTAREPYEAKDDANVGSGVHSYVLQGEAGLDAECFILSPECEGTSKDAKAERACQIESNPGKVPLPHRYGPGPAEGKPAIMDVLRSVERELLAHDKTREILKDSQREVSLIWIDEKSGCTCKARLDLLCKDPFFYDLKKTLELEKFRWQLRSLFYDIQLGHYYNGATANGIRLAGAGFLPCEAKAPFRVACGFLDIEKLKIASIEAVRLIGLVKQSQITGRWPNYRIPYHIQDLDDIQPNDLMEIY
jgi:hypothetical protein